MRISPIFILLMGCGSQIKSDDIDSALLSDDTVDTAYGDTGTVDTGSDTTDTTDTADTTDTLDTSDTSDTSDTGSQVNDVMVFDKIELFDMPGTAWVHPADLNGDGFDEYLITSMSEGVGDWPTFIGAGAAYVVSRDGGTPNGTLGTWSADMIFDRTYEIDWPNDSNMFDVNNDGIQDWVVGTGFIPIPDGGILWMEGFERPNGSTGFYTPAFLDTPHLDHFYHKAYPIDIDSDGDMDFITSSFKNAETDWFGNETSPGTAKLEWYENEGIPGVASFIHHHIADRGGTLMSLHDVDNDGDTDIILPQYFNGASLIWMENPSSAGSWTEHVISNNTGRGFDVELADMDDDGQLDLVYANHNHQLATDPLEQTMGLYWFEIPSASEVRNLQNWNDYIEVIFEGFYVDESDPNQNGAPGVFHTGDVNGDGRMDVSVSGDGDDGLYVFTQELDGSFSETLVDTGTVMGGDHHMADLDGDGDMDFIWAIYGAQDLFQGQLAPQSAVNIYLQETGSSNGGGGGAGNMNGTINFEISTSFGPDSCTGQVTSQVSGSAVSGGYTCSFGVIGSQNEPIIGTVDGNGNVSGTIGVSVSFANESYELPWTGTYDGTTLNANVSNQAASLGSMDITYSLSFSAQ